MNKLIKAIYIHLITKPKYNKKCLEVDMLKLDIKNILIEQHEEENIHKIEKQVWEQKLKEQEEKIIEFKKKQMKNKTSK